MSQSNHYDKNCILENNLNFLREYNPSVYIRLTEKLKVESDNENIIEIVQTKNGLTNLCIYHEDKKNFVHSNYDPYKEGLIIADVEDDGFDTIMILGFGMGYHVEQISKRYPERNKFIIEPDIDLFIECIKIRDVRNILRAKNVTIMLSDNPGEIYNEITTLYRYSLVYSLKFVQLGYYNKCYGSMWEKLQSDFLKFFNTHVVNIKTIMLFNIMWLYNFFMNIRHLNKTANFNAFENKFESVPAILVSAGPSLDKNIHYLKGLEEKALILASGSALTALLKNGIIPHMALGIDGGKTMSDVYNEVQRDDILLTFVPNLHYDCVNKYKGPKLYIRSTSEPHVDYFEKFAGIKTNGIVAGGSVSNVALDVLFKMGCDPIILIGQDLAFTNMKTHVEGTLESSDFKDKSEMLEKDKRFTKTKDMYGNDIYTNKTFLSMKYWFDSYFTNSKGKRTFINASAGGVKLENAEAMEISVVLDKYCNKNMKIRPKIFDLFEESIKNNTIDQDKIKDFILSINKIAKKSMDYSHKRLKICENILNDLKKGMNKSYSSKLKEINKITEKLENDEFYKAFILSRCTDTTLAYKNNAEQQAMEASTINEKLKILYGGLLKQFKDVDEKVTMIYKITDDVKKEFESEAIVNE